MKYIKHNTGLFLKWLAKKRTDSYGNDTIFERFENPAKDHGLQKAVQRLAVGAPFFTSGGYLKQYDRADWQHVDARIQYFAAKLIETMRQRNIPLYVHGAFRTQLEQETLFANGRTKTRYPKAAHCQGAAVDIVHSQYHWELSESEWQYIGKVGNDLATQLGIPVKWGGEWSFYDPAHWELKGWQDHIKYPTARTPIRKTPRAILRAN